MKSRTTYTFIFLLFAAATSTAAAFTVTPPSILRHRHSRALSPLNSQVEDKAQELGDTIKDQTSKANENIEEKSEELGDAVQEEVERHTGDDDKRMYQKTKDYVVDSASNVGQSRKTRPWVLKTWLEMRTMP